MHCKYSSFQFFPSYVINSGRKALVVPARLHRSVSVPLSMNQDSIEDETISCPASLHLEDINSPAAPDMASPCETLPSSPRNVDADDRCDDDAQQIPGWLSVLSMSLEQHQPHDSDRRFFDFFWH